MGNKNFLVDLLTFWDDALQPVCLVRFLNQKSYWLGLDLFNDCIGNCHPYVGFMSRTVCLVFVTVAKVLIQISMLIGLSLM